MNIIQCVEMIERIGCIYVLDNYCIKNLMRTTRLKVLKLQGDLILLSVKNAPS